MTHRRARFLIILFCASLLSLPGTLLYAQGGATTATLSGVVVDSSGAVIPGASVVVKDIARGAEYPAVTGPDRHRLCVLEPVPGPRQHVAVAAVERIARAALRRSRRMAFAAGRLPPRRPLAPLGGNGRPAGAVEPPPPAPGVSRAAGRIAIGGARLQLSGRTARPKLPLPSWWRTLRAHSRR